LKFLQKIFYFFYLFFILNYIFYIDDFSLNNFNSNSNNDNDNYNDNEFNNCNLNPFFPFNSFNDLYKKNFDLNLDLDLNNEIKLDHMFNLDPDLNLNLEINLELQEKPKIKNENIFYITKIKKNEIRKKKEIKAYINKVKINKYNNNNKSLFNINDNVNDKYNNNKIEKENLINYPNSLINISKEVSDYLKKKTNLHIKYLNERVFSKIKKTDKISEKNIQRRVYDAINVMCAIGLLNKEKGSLYYKDEFYFRKNLKEKINANEIIKEELYKKEINVNQKLLELIKIYIKVNFNFIFF
jgi:hypothetical protein